jgi:hypothetical protein
VAFATKRARCITVDGHAYRWLVRQEEDLRNTLVIRGAGCSGQRVRAWFAGEHAFASEEEVAALGVRYRWGCDEEGFYYQPTAVIAPRVVAAVIRRALAQGWTPLQPGTDLILRLPAPSVLGSDV